MDKIIEWLDAQIRNCESYIKKFEKMKEQEQEKINEYSENIKEFRIEMEEYKQAKTKLEE